MNLQSIASVLGDDVVTEDSVALFFAKEHKDELLYCHTTKAWFIWTGNHWQQEQTRLAFQYARELARNVAQSEKDRIRLITAKTAFASGVEKFAQSDRTFAVTSDDWNKDEFLLATPGGTVDLRTGELKIANPND